MIKLLISAFTLLLFLTSCDGTDNCYKKYQPLTKLSPVILEEADQIFINSNNDIVLIMNVGELFRPNYHILYFNRECILQDETHISSLFIDSIQDNTIFSTYQLIEGRTAYEERFCKTDSVGSYRLSFNTYSRVSGNKYDKNLMDSIVIDSSFLVHVYYRTRPKEAYYDIDNIIGADSLLTEKHSRILHINNLNFFYGELFSIRHPKIVTSDNSLFIHEERFKPKNAHILPKFYKQLFDILKK